MLPSANVVHNSVSLEIKWIILVTLGAAFIFESVNGSWTSVANISSPVPIGSLFGSSVSIFDDFAVVGAYGYGEDNKFYKRKSV